ncbi:MAG: hypothetical protein HYY25_14050 [Candidatus Wallbacteria bacterium]|nr:hypothetical protein [Candidatus Wallbacteria bacterium]
MALRPRQRGPDALQALLPEVEIRSLLARVSTRHFGGEYADVKASFVRQRQLACISPLHRHIWLHEALNSPDVPETVFETILFHELLHLEIPPGPDSSGRMKMHPDSFRVEEGRRCPSLSDSWRWLGANLHLKHDEKQECTQVVKRLLRLSDTQRRWALETLGVSLPRVIRLGDSAWRLAPPAYRTAAFEASLQLRGVQRISAPSRDTSRRPSKGASPV